MTAINRKSLQTLSIASFIDKQKKPLKPKNNNKKINTMHQEVCRCPINK